MPATLWLPLVVKALATALLVVSASVAAEAFGPAWGALIASLPVSAGPAYVFLTLQHEPGFVTASALSSSAGNAATGLFLVTLGLLDDRLPFWRRLGAAIAVWLLATWALRQANWTAAGAAALNISVYGPALLLVRRSGAAALRPVPTRPSRRRWFDLPLRAASVAGFVSLIVAGSEVLGPTATGFAAVFPVSLISVIVILQRRLGSPAVTMAAIKALPSMLGFGAMLLVLHLAILPVGAMPAIGLALAFCILWSGALILVQTRRAAGSSRRAAGGAAAEPLP